jgi:hypothetical protein
MVAMISSTLLKRGLKNAAIVGAGSIAVIGLATYGLAAVTDRPLRWARDVVEVVSWVLILTFFFVTWVRARAQRGAVVLDCGSHPVRWLFFLCAAMAVLSVAFSLFAGTSERSVWALGGPVFMILTIPFYLALATGRLQVTELGLWGYWALLPWHKIHSVRWADGSTLMIQANTRFHLLGRSALPVPREHRDAIAKLLAQHGVATTA